MIQTREGLLPSDKIVTEVTNHTAPPDYGTYDRKRTFVEWNLEEEVTKIVRAGLHHWDPSKKINLYSSDEFVAEAQRIAFAYATSTNNVSRIQELEEKVLKLEEKVLKLEDIIRKAGLDKLDPPSTDESEQRKIIV